MICTFNIAISYNDGSCGWNCNFFGHPFWITTKIACIIVCFERYEDEQRKSGR